jgi:carbonic anhydrase/acetyltransferase-like protein (isoleucine patch superfamily)
MILDYLGRRPVLARGVWVAPTACVAGDVELGEDSSVWFGAAVRGDVFHIRVGRRTNIQDNCVVHVTTDRFATIIGDDVTIGHAAVLHGCTVHDRALVGIGAIVLDEAVVGEEAMVAAGALVPPGMHVPPRVLVVGSPARVKRDLTPQELEHLRWSAPHYVEVMRAYRDAPGQGG